MQIGPRHWQWVDINSAGVPHGGPFGDVRHFAAELRRMNLHVGWSRMHECFGIATKSGEKWSCQMMLRRMTGGGAPIPFSKSLLDLLRYTWDRHCRFTNGRLGATIEMMAKQKEEANRKAAEADLADRMYDAVQESLRARGVESRPVFSMGGLTRG